MCYFVDSPMLIFHRTYSFQGCYYLATCYASRQTYVEVNDTYSEGGTHEETLHPQRKAKVMNKR